MGRCHEIANAIPRRRFVAASPRRRVTPPPHPSADAVSDGQARYHFHGQARWWPLLGDDGREGKLKGVVEVPIGSPRRRVATLLRGLTFGRTASRGPASVSSAVLRRSRSMASVSTALLSFERL
jgi:hypothetical protein